MYRWDTCEQQLLVNKNAPSEDSHQAGLNLRWAHMSTGTFSDFATNLSYTKWKKAQTDHAVCCSHIPKYVQLEAMGEVSFVVGSKCFINQ